MSRPEIDKKELHRRMGYHPVTGEAQAQIYEANRGRTINLASHFVKYCPPGRELDKALDALQEALQWANAAVACEETP